MTLQPPFSTRRGSGEMFTGDVYIDTVVRTAASSRVRVNAVHFTPGARTAWHAHALGQYLHITEGVALVQERGGAVDVLRPGDTIFTPAGVWHWHGAGGDRFMTHLSVWEAPEEGAETAWGHHVTDEEYEAADRRRG